MKLENKEEVDKICKEIERIEEGLAMLDMAEERDLKLTFAVSTSDARGFILQDAYFFHDSKLVENVVKSAKMKIKELLEKLG